MTWFMRSHLPQQQSISPKVWYCKGKFRNKAFLRRSHKRAFPESIPGQLHHCRHWEESDNGRRAPGRL